jgi:hypothetical protein
VNAIKDKESRSARFDPEQKGDLARSWTAHKGRLLADYESAVGQITLLADKKTVRPK